MSDEESTPAIGLLLLNEHGNPVYCNSVAEAVLCYPKTLDNEAERNQKVGDKVRTELLRLCDPTRQQARFISGRRSYACRTLRLEPARRNGNGPTTAIILERSSRRNESVRRQLEAFKLTPREREAVLLLADGLTSQEIAQRMNISPNTVKAFLHFVMMKLGVTTRSGIIGKVNGRR